MKNSKALAQNKLLEFAPNNCQTESKLIQQANALLRTPPNKELSISKTNYRGDAFSTCQNTDAKNSPLSTQTKFDIGKGSTASKANRAHIIKMIGHPSVKRDVISDNKNSIGRKIS